METRLNRALGAVVIFALKITVMLVQGKALAQLAEISDGPNVNVRQGGARQYPVIASLGAHTPVEVIETGRPYAQVKMSDGRQGWLLQSRLVFWPEAYSQPPDGEVLPNEAPSADESSTADHGLPAQQVLQHEPAAHAKQKMRSASLAALSGMAGFVLGMGVKSVMFRRRYRGLMATERYQPIGRWGWNW